MPGRHLAWTLEILAATLWLCASGCEEPLPSVRPGPDDVSNRSGRDAATPQGAASTACRDRPDGEPCSGGRHCVDERCVHNICGDGVVAADEACDDGNERTGDGCSPACEMAPGPACGDGNLDDGEECDDGNLVGGDDCSAGCTRVVCGNGRRDPGEECDDGNDDDTDYCSRSCERWLCRNGRLDPGEACDDGNSIHDDGCTNDCRMQGCGDGVVETTDPTLLEECDDANEVNDDACSNLCTLNVCGNARTDPGEVCDGDTTDEGVCNGSCSGYEVDRCEQCLAEQCTDYEGLDFYTPCLVESSPENVFEWRPAFTAQCTAVERCFRRSECVPRDGTNNVTPCICQGELDSVACRERAGFPDGPCVDEMLEAAPDSCRDGSTEVAACLLDLFSDVFAPYGFAVYLRECGHYRCPDVCPY